jgi:6-pyruvoyltetrahydropterin/6-carboxytetrahydropterin synthase
LPEEELLAHIEITRKIEFDAGHRIPDHGSKCYNIHGHRYVLEATLHGTVVETKGQPDTGMVQDFGTFKSVMMDAVGEPWDHAFLCYKHDGYMLNALANLDLPARKHKTVLLSAIPTVENLAMFAFDLIDKKIKSGGTYRLERVRLYETPNCWADYDRSKR